MKKIVKSTLMSLLVMTFIILLSTQVSALNIFPTYNFTGNGDIDIVSPDGNLLLTTYGELWDLTLNRRLLTVNTMYITTTSAFSHDSKKLIVNERTEDFMSIEAVLYDMDTMQKITSSSSMSGNIIGFTADNQYIITFEDKVTIGIYDATTLELKSTINTGVDTSYGNRPNFATYNSARDEIAVMGYNIIRMFDTTGKTIRTINLASSDRLELPEFSSGSLAYSDNGKYIILRYFPGGGQAARSYIYDIGNENYNMMYRNGHSVHIRDDLFLNENAFFNLATDETYLDCIQFLTFCDSTGVLANRVFPETKIGYNGKYILDLNELFRYVTEAELSIPEYVELDSEIDIELTVTYSDGYKQKLEFGTYKISTSNARIGSIDNQIFSAISLGTVDITVNFLDFTYTKEVQVTVFPKEIKAKTVDEESIELTWDKSVFISNVNGYYIYRTTEQGVYSDVPLQSTPINSSITTYIDRLAKVNVVYYYTYRLVLNDGSLSPMSNEVAVMIETDEPVTPSVPETEVKFLVARQTTIARLVEIFGEETVVYDKSGKEITTPSTFVGTNMIITLPTGTSFIIVVQGDLTGNGSPDIRDAQIYLESLVGNSTLNEVQVLALEDVVGERDSAIKKLRAFLNFIK